MGMMKWNERRGFLVRRIAAERGSPHELYNNVLESSLPHRQSLDTNPNNER